MNPETRACEDCGASFEARIWNRVRCDACRAERRKAKQRVGTLPERTCAECGATFTPYKGDQLLCGKTACLREHDNARRRKEDTSAHDEQMERLFRYYKSRSSLEIPERKDGTRVVVLSDTQFPFADLKLLDAVDRFIDDWKPDDLVYLGDICDAYEISDFDKRPERLFNLEDEFAQAKDWAHGHRLRSPKVKQWWADGNHEERLTRTIWRKAQGFSFLVADVAEALELEKWAAGFVPYGKHIDYLGYTMTHGNFVSQYSAYTAKRHFDKYHSSGCNGHTHRLGSYSHTDMHGKSSTWDEIGCLCRRDLDYVKGVANWQHGFLVGTVWKNALHKQLVHVIETDEGRGFSVEGTYYEVKR